MTNTAPVVVTDAAAIVFDQGLSVQGIPRTKMVMRNVGEMTAYIGGEDVDTTIGFPVKTNEFFTVSPVGKNEEVWGVCAEGESTELRLFWMR